MVPIPLPKILDHSLGEPRQLGKLLRPQAERHGLLDDQGGNFLEVGATAHAGDLWAKCCMAQEKSDAPAMAGGKGGGYDSNRIRAAMLAIMAEKGLTQTKWAEAAGVGKFSLRRFLNGDDQVSINLKSAFKLAHAANVPLTRLLGLDEETATAKKQGRGDVPLDRIKRAFAAAGEILSQLAEDLDQHDPPDGHGGDRPGSSHSSRKSRRLAP